MSSNPGGTVYGGQGGSAQQVVSHGPLPFTGLDLTLLVAGAVALIMLGLVLRRVSRNL